MIKPWENELTFINFIIMLQIILFINGKPMAYTQKEK